MALQDLLDRLRRRRVSLPDDDAHRVTTYPPPYPAGWYRVLDADALRPAQVRQVTALGERLAVFRDAAGRAHALDAHCPHQGANLAGGVVRGDCLECPFHGWRFEGEGRVRSIPYAKKVSPSLRTRAWPLREYAGMLLVYFDPSRPERDGGFAPPYELALPEGLSEMRFRGRQDAGPVRMHLIEFAENSVDFAHFPFVHGQMLVPWTSFRVPFVEIEHEATWERDPARPHVAYFHDTATLIVAGKRRPRTSTRATITFHGPGGVVAFRFYLPELGDIVMFQTHTPQAPLQQRVAFRWFADRKVPRALVSYVVGSWITQWKGDIDIWENKIYRQRPMLVPEDGPVHEMRRWFGQFYPEASGSVPRRSLRRAE